MVAAVPAKSGAARKAYLVWDEGFGRQFVASLAGITASLYGCYLQPSVNMFFWDAYQELLVALMDGANRMAWWSAIGLLSSSCCALQLMLNAFNFGCAGFNTVLGPLRPGICAVTVIIQSAVWYTAYDKPFQRLYVVPCTLLALVLTLLPEITAVWVQRKQHKSSSTPRYRVAFAIEGMGCAACTKAVAGVVDSTPSTVSREISLEQKSVSVSLAASSQDVAEICADICSRLDAAGFDAKAGVPEELGDVGPLSQASSIAKSTASDPCFCESTPHASLGGSTSGLFVSIGAGLLSSSCCVLQLGVNLLASLNVAHVGCAGFNKILGPWRLHLRVITGCWLALSWMYSLWQGLPRRRTLRLAGQTALCLVLTFFPELLLWSGGPALAPPTAGAQVLHVKVEGMGCEACQAHVQGVMDRMGGVVGSSVDFRAGKADIVVNKDWAFDFADLARKLEGDGYSASLRSEL